MRPATIASFCVFSLAWGAISLSPTTTFAQGDPREQETDAAALVTRGVELYDDLEYAEAAKLLRRAFASNQLDREGKLTGFRVLGLALLALGKENDARDAFRQLLEIDREFQFGGGENPRAVELLELVRVDLAAAVTLTHEAAPDPGQMASSVTITLSIDDPSNVAEEVVIFYRSPLASSGAPPAEDKRSAKWQRVTKDVDGKKQLAVTIPGSLIRTPSLEYRIEVEAIDGRVVAKEGSAERPLVLGVVAAPVRDGDSVLKSPWLWLGVGAAVVAGVATYFILTSGTDTGFASIETR